MLDGVLDRTSQTYRGLMESKRSETVARINSSIIGIIINLSALYVKTPAEILFVYRIFAGYLLYDIPYAKTASMIGHHYLSIGIYFYINSRASPAELHDMYRALLVLESSPILISVCWIMKAFQYPDNGFHRAIKMAAFLYWSVGRLVVFPYIVYASESSMVKCVTGPFIVLNIYWFTILLRFVMGSKKTA